MTSARKDRGRETERLVARYWQENGFPYAEVVRGAGRDLTGTGQVAVEIKARYGFNPTAWLKQTRANCQPGDVPCVVARMNGQGPATVGQFLVMTDHDTWMRLLKEAGYAA